MRAHTGDSSSVCPSNKFNCTYDGFACLSATCEMILSVG